MNRKKKLIICLVIALLLGGTGGGFYLFHYKPASSPISAELTKQVPFQIYYPSDKKYVLVKDSLYYDSSLQLLHMKFQKGSDLLTVTEQAKPADFNISGIEGTQFLTRVGTGIIISNIADRTTSPASNLTIKRVTGIPGILITPAVIISINTQKDEKDLQDFILSFIAK